MRRTFITAEDLGRFGVLFNIFDDINQVGDFREEWVIVWEVKDGFMIIAWLADVECGLDVRVDESSRNNAENEDNGS